VSLAELAETTFVWIAVLVCIAGFAFRLILLLTRRGGGLHAKARGFPVLGGLASAVSWVAPKPGFLRRDVPGAIAAVVFHVSLVGIVLYDFQHTVFFWPEVLGNWSWEFSFSETLSEVLVWTAGLSLGFMFANRLLNPRRRALSTPGDYFAILLVG
jgi:nitrate reductase gamma subunit